MILITGTCGFIGYHLSRLLSISNDVVGIDNFNDYYDVSLKKNRRDLLDIPIYRCDILDKGMLENIFEMYRPEVVIHLAAYAGVRYSMNHSGIYLMNNVIGFRNILKYCEKYRSKLIYASSSSVYGDGDVPYKESYKPDPQSPYAVTERQAVVSQLAYNTLSLADGVLLLHGAVIPANDHYIGTINAEETGSFKILAGGNSGDFGGWIPARVVVDGVELEQLSGEISLEAGLHTIEIWDDPENSGYYTMFGTESGYFNGCKYNSMIIPDYVTEIIGTFVGCEQLTSVTIPNTVTSIREGAFQGAFEGCYNLTSVTIPNTVTSIGTNAFNYCSSLTSISIPNTVTSIGNGAFSGCSSLTSITCNAINPPTLGGYAFDGTNNCPIYVPASSVNTYKAAAGWSTYASRIQAIQTDSHYIGTINAEESGSFKILAGGDSGSWEWHPARVVVDGVELEELSDYIDLTPGLHTIEIWDDPENSGYYTMYGDGGYFENCAYSSMIIPDYVTEMDNAFHNCFVLTSVTIPNSVTDIGSLAFCSCFGLTSVTIPSSVTSISNGAFYGCSGMTSVAIGNSVTSIGNSAFASCSGLTSVTIPNSVTSIGNNAFGNCSNLTSVTIGNSVTRIENGAFEYCSSLTSIICNAINPPTLGDYAFVDTADCPIYVPATSVDAYKAATGWSDYASRIQAIQS